MSNIRVDNNTKQPKQHMAEVFGGDADAGTIPVHRSTMEVEPVIYTGAFLDAATEVELTEMISEDFKARGVHQHRVRITDGRMVGEHIVIFDDAYEHCAWMPMAVATAEAERTACTGAYGSRRKWWYERKPK
jgi:hypothetical protein